MKTLNIDLNLLTDDELEAYLVVKRASNRIIEQNKKLPKMELTPEEANQGWMKETKIPEPPKFQ